MNYLLQKQLLCILLLISSISFGQKGDSFFENVAITDINTVDNGDNTFYYTITLKDFSKLEALPSGLGLNGYIFMDNGQFNDAKANDGIYSSKEHKPLSWLTSHPINKKVFYDQEFKYQNSLQRSARGLSCKFERCGCPCSNGYSCPACDWHGFNCWIITECQIGIDF